MTKHPDGQSATGQKTSEAEQRLVSLDEFVESLTGCGLMTRAEVQSFIQGLTPDKRPTNGKQLAEELFRQKKLTRFQTQTIYQGRTRGLVVGNYVVLDRLGSGGMGQVYKAQHRRLERVVAIKMLPAAATKSEDSVKRFQREVKTAAKLNHPNIVTAFDADEHKGVHFLVMEYVEGQDLATLVKDNGPVAVATAVDYVLQAARGLAYAHGQGVVHRDIKPANLLLDTRGAVKVLDMGLARMDRSVAQDDGLTRSGQVMGTLDYMAPEQAYDAHRADVPADVYSLGCTLYYLLAGQPPFAGENLTQKILAHREHPAPSLRAVRPDVPEWLETVFQKMLAKQPEHRYRTMRDVVAALEQQSLPQVAPVISPAVAPAGAAETLSPQQISVDTSSDQWLAPPPRPPSAAEPRATAWVGTQWIVVQWVKRRPRTAVAVAAGLLLFAVLLAVVLSLRTKEGTLVVEVHDPDLTIQVLDEQGELLVERKAGQERVSIRIDPGKRRLRLEKNGVVVFSRDITLASGGREVITAHLDAPATTSDGTNPPANMRRSEELPKQPASTAPLRSFGYFVSGLTDPKTVDEIASYANIVSSPAWSPDGLRAARQKGVKTIVWVQDVSPALFDFLRKNADLVQGVCRAGSIDLESMSGFAKQLKEHCPTLEVWMGVGRDQLAVAIEKRLLSELQEVDVWEIGVQPLNPQEIELDVVKNLDAVLAVLPAEKVAIAWISWEEEPSTGKVPKCAPGTFRALAGLAAQRGLVGVMFHDFDTPGHLAGISTRPELVAEIRQAAAELGIGKERGKPSPSNTAASTSGSGKRRGVDATAPPRAKSGAESLKYEDLARGRWVRLVTKQADLNGCPKWKQEPDGAMVDSQGRLTLKQNGVQFQPSAADQALRVRVRVMAGGIVGLSVRGGGEPKSYSASYVAKVDKGLLRLERNSPGNDPIPLAALPYDDLTEKECELCFVAVGDWLKLYIDGRQVLEADDTAYKSGSPGVFAMKSPVEFITVEYQSLDDLPIPAATGTPAEKKAAVESLPGTASSQTNNGPTRPKLRYFGYAVPHAMSAVLNETASYTNCVSSSISCSPEGVRSARQKDLKFLVDVYGEAMSGEEQPLYAFLRKHQGNVVAVRWGDPPKNDEIPGFAKRLKAQFPGVQCWISVGDWRLNPLLQNRALLDSREVDVWQIGCSPLTADEVDRDVARKVAELLKVLPAQRVAVSWGAWEAPPSAGRVPKCKPGTFRALAKLAVQHGLVAFTFHDYYGSGLLAGLSTRPDLVEEIREAAADIGISKNAKPPTVSVSGTEPKRPVPMTWPAGAPPLAKAPYNAAQARRYQDAWAKYLNVPLEFTNSVGQKFILVPPGEFDMGSTQDELDQLAKTTLHKAPWQPEVPRHRVRLSRPLYVCVHEATQSAYQRVMKANPSHFSSTGTQKARVVGVDASRLPVDSTSWHQATEFCRQLSSLPDEVKLGRAYRLPTEAEWEHACRAGTNTRFPTGDDAAGLRAIANVCDEACQKAQASERSNESWNDGFPVTAPVGSFQANAFGLYDMTGNVGEWCLDWYDFCYYQQSPQVDPTGPGTGFERTVRGGCWANDAYENRAAYRWRFPPDASGEWIGFRIVCDVATDQQR